MNPPPVRYPSAVPNILFLPPLRSFVLPDYYYFNGYSPRSAYVPGYPSPFQPVWQPFWPSAVDPGQTVYSTVLGGQTEPLGSRVSRHTPARVLPPPQTEPLDLTVNRSVGLSNEPSSSEPANLVGPTPADGPPSRPISASRNQGGIFGRCDEGAGSSRSRGTCLFADKLLATKHQR